MTIERKHYIIGGLIIALALALQPFALLFTQINLAPSLVPMLTGNNVDGTPSLEGREVSTENLKLRGNSDAQIVLVEFSDYECPFCNRFHEAPKNIVANSNGKVAWAWKHYPLPFHPQAEPTAIAAECVKELAGVEQFWSYTDTMMNNFDKLNDTLRASEAGKLGINAANFSTCLKNPEMKTRVSNDLNEGSSLGVNGTPNTFIVRNEGGKYTILESINGALPEATVAAAVAKYVQ
jgi:protein-disulfide isomerase